MTRSHSRSTAAAAIAALALAACSTASRSAPGSSPQPATASRSDSAAVAKAGAQAARHRYTRADVEFMSHMIGHHAQALVMAGWAPTHGAGFSVRTLAERIINGQQDEIATMQRWLRDRRQAVPVGESHGVHHHTLMPGMLTESQMRELDRARGREFDRLFLTYMIQHHKGAVTMVNDLFGTRGAGQEEAVFKLASDVSADQSSEISRMERLLAEVGNREGSP